MVYDYPLMRGVVNHYFGLVHSSDEYLLAIRVTWQEYYVGILHKPFNRWLPPVPVPVTRPLVPFGFVLQECYALPKPLSFAMYFYDRLSEEHCMMFYSISPSCDNVVRDRCVSLGVQRGTPRDLQTGLWRHVASEITRVLLSPDRGSMYLVSRDSLDIKEISMADGDRAKIGNFVRYPNHWMIYEHTIYAVHLDNVCKLRVCAFDVQRRRWIDERSHCVDSSKASSQIYGLYSHRNVFLICYQQCISVLDVETGGFRYVDIRHLALANSSYTIAGNDTRFRMLENGELVLLSFRQYTPWSDARYATRCETQCETRLRVVAAFQPHNLFEIARRAVHVSMPAETWKALGASPLADSACLVRNLSILMKPEKSRKRKCE